MSKSWNNEEIQRASEQMKKLGSLSYEEFLKEIEKQKED